MALSRRIAFEPADPDDPTLSVDGLGDLLPERGDRSDPTLAVSALDDFFEPRPVAPIAQAAKEPRLLVCRTEENAKSGRPAAIDAGDRKLPLDIQRAAMEFQRLADKFHAFAAALAIPQPN